MLVNIASIYFGNAKSRVSVYNKKDRGHDVTVDVAAAAADEPTSKKKLTLLSMTAVHPINVSPKRAKTRLLSSHRRKKQAKSLKSRAEPVCCFAGI